MSDLKEITAAVTPVAYDYLKSIKRGRRGRVISMAVLAWRDKLEPPDWDLLWQFSARLQQDIEMREATGDGKTDDGLRTLCALDDVLAKVRRWL